MKQQLGTILIALWAIPALAGPARPGVAVARAWLVPVEDSGRLEVVDDPRPPDAAEALYTLRFRYDGEGDAEGLEIVQRVPAGTRYVPGSATGPGAVVTFSVDGGTAFDIPEALEVAGPSGPARPATADDYTHIRWSLPGRFPPGTSGVVSFRAQPVEQATEPAAAGNGR